MLGNLSEERQYQLAEVAKLYYQKGMPQHEIARWLKLTRYTVAHMLQEARDTGIVEITINKPIARDASLEQKICHQFQIQEAVVVASETSEEDEALHQIGVFGAKVLSQYIENGMVLGITDGTSVRSVVDHLQDRRLPEVKVVQLTGGVGATGQKLDAAEQCARVGRSFGARHYYLNAPLIVETTKIARALKQDPAIRDVLSMSARTQIALMGIGSLDPQASTQFHTGYLSFQELRDLEKVGAVGSVGTALFDIMGQPINAPWLAERYIGVSWNEISTFGLVIGLAGGSAKGQALIGALRSGLIHILVTDHFAAREALSYLE